MENLTFGRHTNGAMDTNSITGTKDGKPFVCNEGSDLFAEIMRQVEAGELVIAEPD